MNAPERMPFRHVLYLDLLARPATDGSTGDPNRVILASLIAGQTADYGCLPGNLGLGEEGFRQLLADYFPGEIPLLVERPATDLPERDELLKLLRDARAGERDSEDWIASILATACAGRDHLWQDLGLASRDELSQLMWINFPSLARANTGDMKWKKFLYRQFCAREGIYVCPAPSCSVCTDFAKCFGPEN